jgi:D-alanine transaminase/branched-chain amino acid aminotransferase
MEQQLLAYRDGKYLPKDQISIGIDDLGFERGFAVFDYCRERNGKITFLKEHLQRLEHSQSLLRLHFKADMHEVKKVLETLQTKNNLQDSYFKCIISARMINKNISAIITVYQDVFIPYDVSMFDNGITLILHEYAKPFPEYKTTFYLGSLREYDRMLENNAEDILFYYDNIVRECSRCNIFIIKGGLIYTPDKNILKGVTRHHVMNCLKEQFMVIEKDISIKELFEADEVFISSTTKNIMPVVKIEDQIIGNGAPGNITKLLIPLFENYCNNYVAD